VGVFSVIILFAIIVVFLLLALPLLGLLGTDSLFFEIYTSIIGFISMFISVVLVPGALLGIVLARLRQERAAYTVDPSASEEAG
jgi:hypothetical protein